jgi:hypothetical protein
MNGLRHVDLPTKLLKGRVHGKWLDQAAIDILPAGLGVNGDNVDLHRATPVAADYLMRKAHKIG